MARGVWIIGADGEMRPGYYRVRLVKDGPYVPAMLAEIAPDRDDDGEWLSDFRYLLLIDSIELDPFNCEPKLGEPITEAEYQFLLATREYDRRHGTALADARQKIDPLTAPLPI